MTKTYKQIDENTFEASEEKVVVEAKRYTKAEIASRISSLQSELSGAIALLAELNKLPEFVAITE